MNFLFPGFLFALAAVAIPVIIHLFNFRRFKKVYFSNVSFLKEVQQQTSSSRHLKNIWILVARMFAIVFLVLAFAQPYIPLGNNSSSTVKPQVVSVYIDNSYSMETLNREGSLLDEAKRRAKEIASAYHLNTKFHLLTNDFEGKHQRLISFEDFNDAVDEVSISGVNRTFQQVLKRQASIYQNEPRAEKVSYVISDFQKNFLNTGKYTPDSSVALRLVLLSANELANVSVDSLWFTSPVHRVNTSEQLVVQLRNNSNQRAENIPVKVLVDGRTKVLGSVSIDARASVNDTLSFSGLAAGWKQGEVVIEDHPVAFDNRFHFTFNVRDRMPLMVIHEGSPNVYLNALYSAERFFNLQNVSAGNINYSQLGNFPFAILSGTRGLSGALASQLKIYVQNGGSLMVFPDLDEGIEGLRVLSNVLGTDAPQGLSTQTIKVSAINLQHPLFSGVFSRVPQKVDLPTASRMVVYANNSKLSKQSIIQAPGGRSFLSQFQLGKGKVYLSAVALSEQSSNLVRHSIFVPLMYQSAFLSLRDKRLFYTLGRDQFLEMDNIELRPNQTLKLVKGSLQVIPDVRTTERGTRLFISDQVRQPGIFNLFRDAQKISSFAFNDTREESDLSYFSKADLGDKFSSKAIQIFAPEKGSLQNAVKAANNGIQLWKLCLILALVFLAAEIMLVRYYKPR